MVIVPRSATVMAQIMAHDVELGEIWNVFRPGLHTNVGTVMRIAALVGQFAPVNVRLPVDCVK